MRSNRLRGRGAVRLLEASLERIAEAIFLGSDDLNRIASQQGTHLRAALQRHPPGESRKKSCAIRVAYSGRVHPGGLPRNGYVQPRLTRDLDAGPLGASSDHPDGDPLQ